eukprot:5372223-Prymnesium_polylepis.1
MASTLAAAPTGTWATWRAEGTLRRERSDRPPCERWRPLRPRVRRGVADSLCGAVCACVLRVFGCARAVDDATVPCACPARVSVGSRDRGDRTHKFDQIARGVLAPGRRVCTLVCTDIPSVCSSQLSTLAALAPPWTIGSLLEHFMECGLQLGWIWYGLKARFSCPAPTLSKTAAF